jgi:hypothetical protein
MARRSSIALVLLLAGFVLGVGGLATWVLIDSEAAREVQASAAGSPDRVPPARRAVDVAAPAEEPEVESAGAVAVEAEPTRAAAQRTEAGGAELRGAHWIEGRVLLPDGTPFGERVEILARGKSFENRPLHRAVVKSDGTFRVAFAPDTRTGWLVMEADHVYIDKPHRIKPRDADETVVLEAKLGGRIAGVVVVPVLPDEDHAAMVGEKVELEGSDPDELTDLGHKRSTALDETLAFAIGGLPPGLDYEVTLDSEVVTQASVDGLSITPGETTEIELESTLGVRVSGRVLGASGMPVEGVELHTFSKEEDNEERWGLRPREVEVGEDGRFLARGVLPGQIAVVASRDGYFGARVDIGARSDGDRAEGVELTLGRGNFVRGRVEWPEGDLVSECTIGLSQDFEEDDSVPFDVWSHYISKDEHEVETGLDGTFEITGLGPGPYEIRASAVRPDEKGRRRKRGPRWTAQLPEVFADTEGLVITLGQGAVVSGRVVDEAGTPLDRFSVQAMPESERTMFMMGGNFWFDSDEGLSRKFYDADGVFTLDGFQPGVWRVRAIAEGHQDAEPIAVELPAEGKQLELIVPRVAVLSGVVVDPAGNPLAAANVAASSTGGPAWMKMLDKHGARTDESGAYEIDDAPTGRVTVRARARGFAASADFNVDLQPGQVLTGVNLALRRGGRITGQLLSTAGESVAGRKIEIDTGEWSFMDRGTRTDESGAFSYDNLPPGTYGVSATLSEEERRAFEGDGEDWATRLAAQKRATVVLEGDETVHVVLGAIPESAVLVTGVVTRSGEPVGGAQIWAAPVGTRVRGNQTRSANSRADGSYELALDEPGEYSFTVSGENQARRSHVETVPDTDQHIVDLELPSGLIAGRVVAPDGDALDEMPVMLSISAQTAESRSFGVSGWEQTDEDGNFRFEGVAEGEYVLTAGNSLWTRGEDAEYGTAVAEVELGEDEVKDGVVLIVERAATVTGTVRGSDGRPISGASIFVRTEGGALLAQWSMVITDGAGRYRRTGLNSGTWTLSARKGTSASAESRPVRVSSGGSAEVDLVLEPSTILVVHTSDAEGNPVGASLSVTDEAGREYRSMQSIVDQGLLESYQEGIARVVGPLPPGEYRVTVSNHDGVSSEAAVRLHGQERETIQMQLGGEHE